MKHDPGARPRTSSSLVNREIESRVKFNLRLSLWIFYSSNVLLKLLYQFTSIKAPRFAKKNSTPLYVKSVKLFFFAPISVILHEVWDRWWDGQKRTQRRTMSLKNQWCFLSVNPLKLKEYGRILKREIIQFVKLSYTTSWCIIYCLITNFENELSI